MRPENTAHCGRDLRLYRASTDKMQVAEGCANTPRPTPHPHYRKGADVIMAHPTQNQLPISPELASLLAPRILRGVTKEPGGCWIRTVIVASGTGYTRIKRMVDRQVTYYFAHRVMYVYANGPIADGLTVDHLCDRPACCNPDHLRAVPHHENVLRSRTNFYAINARKTHCLRGHELPPHEVGRKRGCRPCGRIRQAEYAARKRVEA